MKYDKVIDDSIIRVEDFPKPGVLFYDITGLFLSPKAFHYCVDCMVDLYKDRQIDVIATIESRGFFFSTPLALRLQLPLVLMRKKGKLPRKTREISYDLEYGTDVMEVHQDDISPGNKVLIVDDVLATGGTTAAACNLIESCGAEIVSVFAVIALSFLSFQDRLSQYPVDYLVEYITEKK